VRAVARAGGRTTRARGTRRPQAGLKKLKKLKFEYFEPNLQKYKLNYEQKPI
jgi:hypothetical protein